MTSEKMSRNKELYISALRQNCRRDGVEQLISYLEKSDFFTAPCSTKYHLSEDGGLCQHSLIVYRALSALAESALVSSAGLAYSQESIAIVALLHDLCKIGCYHKGKRNVKQPNGKWGKVDCFEFNDTFPYGHGEKSAYIAGAFIHLTREEAAAIRWHMGFSDESSDKRNIGKAFEVFKLAWLLHTADGYATYIVEPNMSSAEMEKNNE